MFEQNINKDSNLFDLDRASQVDSDEDQQESAPDYGMENFELVRHPTSDMSVGRHLSYTKTIPLDGSIACARYSPSDKYLAAALSNGKCYL
jgi:hypothetical protein